MRISAHNAQSFFKFMDDAKVKLKHLGDRGKPYVERLQDVRKTFKPDDITPAFFERIEVVVTDMATHLVERDMKPVAQYQKIEPAPKALIPEAAAAIGYINDAVNWLRTHSE
jgi:hypothetical protein